MNLINKIILSETVNDDRIESSDKVETVKVEEPRQKEVETKIEPTVSKTELDELQDRIELQEMFGLNEAIELLYAFDRFLYESINNLDNIIIKEKASKYKILSETVDGEERENMITTLAESTNGSLWSSLINIISNFIERCKRVIMELPIKVASRFSLYTAFVSKYEKKLKEYDGNKTTSVNVEKMHDWDTNKLFTVPNFSKLHEFASTILGNVSDDSKMIEKLDEFSRRSWSTDDIYGYIMSKCIGVKCKGKEYALSAIYSSIKGKEKTVSVTLNEAKKYITDLKRINSHVLSMAAKSKMSIMNPEFNVMLKDAKKQSAGDSNDSIRVRYFKERYRVLSIAQNVAFDIYFAYIKLFGEYASEMKTCLKLLSDELLESSLDESAQFLKMNNELIDNAYVLQS